MWPGFVMAALGAVAFSGKAIIAKLAYRYGVDAVTLLMYRMLFSLPFFVLMAWWAGRGKPVLTQRQWVAVFGLGFSGYYLASYLDFLGLQYISASLERLILYLNPTLVLMLGWMLYGRRIGLRQALAMAVSYSGVLLVFGHEASFEGSATAIGGVLVFGAALSYAVYLIFSGEFVNQLGSLRLVGLATTVACVLCIAQFVLLRPMSAANVAPEVINLSLFNAVFCTVVPVLLVMMGIERIGAGLASQFGMIGPMSTLLMGAYFLDEPLNMWVGVGTVLVLLGVFWASKIKRVY
ncbi:MAG: DMT family transporter [Burkholderiales bacterium]|jgi:drug/metabolite transporter (DMT)-like permease|tara:strand:+ start:3909 stop:4787 length:879 start_codon:yes stop_codon:yes gene_type:complete